MINKILTFLKQPIHKRFFWGSVLLTLLLSGLLIFCLAYVIIKKIQNNVHVPYYQVEPAPLETIVQITSTEPEEPEMSPGQLFYKFYSTPAANQDVYFYTPNSPIYTNEEFGFQIEHPASSVLTIEQNHEDGRLRLSLGRNLAISAHKSPSSVFCTESSGNRCMTTYDPVTNIMKIKPMFIDEIHKLCSKPLGENNETLAGKVSWGDGGIGWHKYHIFSDNGYYFYLIEIFTEAYEFEPSTLVDPTYLATFRMLPGHKSVPLNCDDSILN